MFYSKSSLDTSKQRHQLRKKISDEKADLAKLISEYNDLTSTVCKVEIADAMDNNFPWALPDQCGGKFSYHDRYLNQYYFVPIFMYFKS